MNLEQILGLALSGAGATSYYLATRQSIKAYYVGLSTQVVWVAFAFLTGALTLLVSVMVFTAVNGLGLRRALAARRAERAQADTPEGAVLAG